MTTAAVTSEVEALTAQVAVLRDQHNAVGELEGRRRSRAALRRWGDPIPAALTESRDIDALVDRHRHAWLADAAAYVRCLDWRALNGRQLAVVDFEDVPSLPTPKCIAFTTAVGMFELLRPHLKPSLLPAGPAMLVGSRAIAAALFDAGEIHKLTEAEASRFARIAVVSVALHEYAHTVDMATRGIALRPQVTLAQIGASAVTLAGQRVHHSASWVRAYAHLIHRSQRSPAHHEHYSSEFAAAVEAYGMGAAADILAAVAPEVDAYGVDAPLTEILREPACADFKSLCVERGAAQPATLEN